MKHYPISFCFAHFSLFDFTFDKSIIATVFFSKAVILQKLILYAIVHGNLCVYRLNCRCVELPAAVVVG